MKKIRSKTIILTIIVAVAVLIAAVVIAAVFPDREKRPVVILSDTSGAVKSGKSMIIVGGKSLPDIPKGEIRTVSQSADGSAVLFAVGDGGSSPLYSVYNAKIRTLVSEILSTTAAALCYDGSAGFTLDELGVLTWYDIKKNSGRVISESASDCVISPAGEYLLYLSHGDETVLELVRTDSGKETNLGSRYRPVAVSDDAGLIYVTDTQTGGYCLINKDGLEKARFTSELRKDSPVFFTSDLSETVFSDKDYTYVSSQGGKKKTVAPSGCSPLFTGGSVKLTCTEAEVCGVPSFEDYYIDSETSDLYCRDGSGFEKVTEGYAGVLPVDGGACVLTAQGAVVIRHGKKVTDTVNTGYEKPNVYISENGKRLYYGGPDGKYYLYSGGETMLAAEDAVRFIQLGDEAYMYITADGQIYYASKIGKEFKVDS
ncbi:MAG: hypothetical protein K6G90_14335 [Clostridia bacterium]|nr:hypothetical protein [Clostridia bacterium]